ncbi:MAG: Holliday junction resolvase RuvX [Candidatus Pacebacteria bacterium]|nr:Holliday junction resolvase RuvX [Candidatus Paceibacterota bacterium]MBP9840071.1 Holliday junction resolvase RuvX [Candidatus Paceibacterota bacterium]
MRYLGIDYGTKKVGLALSDENAQMGFPRGILPNDPELLPKIIALIAERSVGGIVMGESLALDGSENPVAHEAKTFATRLTDATGIAVSWEPEVFTTREARRMQEPSERSRKPQSRADVDDSAAALILTSFLSRPKP